MSNDKRSDNRVPPTGENQSASNKKYGKKTDPSKEKPENPKSSGMPIFPPFTGG